MTISDEHKMQCIILIKYERSEWNYTLRVRTNHFNKMK